MRMIENRGLRRWLAASIAAVALLGAGLVAVTRLLPPVMERDSKLQRLAAQNEALRRQLQGEPLRHLGKRSIAEMLKRPEPGELVFILNTVNTPQPQKPTR